MQDQNFLSRVENAHRLYSRAAPGIRGGRGEELEKERKEGREGRGREERGRSREEMECGKGGRGRKGRGREAGQGDGLTPSQDSWSPELSYAAAQT